MQHLDYLFLLMFSVTSLLAGIFLTVRMNADMEEAGGFFLFCTFGGILTYIVITTTPWWWKTIMIVLALIFFVLGTVSALPKKINTGDKKWNTPG